MRSCLGIESNTAWDLSCAGESASINALRTSGVDYGDGWLVRLYMWPRMVRENQTRFFEATLKRINSFLLVSSCVPQVALCDQRPREHTRFLQNLRIHDFLLIFNGRIL